MGSTNDGSGFGFTLPFTQAGSRENVFTAISTRSGTNTAPFAFVLNANQSYCYGKMLDGFGDGIYLKDKENSQIKIHNELSFNILQSTRTRISKTESASCKPDCGLA
mgnify:CR=1 FL=1